MTLPRNIPEWLDEIRAIPSHDEDCVLLFTGVERSGKSNTAQTLLYQIDPTFGVHRIAWNNEAFFDIVRELPKGHAVLHDEAKVNARRAMSKSTIELLDWLQVCGGLNHYIGLCFPRAHRIDTAIAERTRYNIHMTARGRAVMRVYTGNEEIPWKELFAFNVERLPDVYREPYLIAKEAAARDALAREERKRSAGIDHAGLVADLKMVRHVKKDR